MPSSCPQLLFPDVVCAQMPCFQCGQMNTTTTILNDFGQPVFQCRCVRLAGKIDMFRVSRSIRAVLARERVSVVRCVLVYVFARRCNKDTSTLRQVCTCLPVSVCAMREDCVCVYQFMCGAFSPKPRGAQELWPMDSSKSRRALSPG